MKIQNYIEDGFSKVCDVIIHPDRDDQWYYENVDYKFVGPDKRSWLYFIVKGEDIVKCGESGNPLLLETKGKNPRWKKGTFSRLGRYINGCTTDTVIREELYNAVTKGTVSIWARQLPVDNVIVTVMDKDMRVERSIHKDLEMVYLDHFVTEYGQLPPLNKGRK
jgi:hypothetical protein|tara:strand:- start:14 stop:505 length:492 start_codon:yes stop_codon:yes gene_type:complete